MEKIKKDRFFSVVLNSKSCLKNASLADDNHESILVEGTIGELLHAEFTEGVVLEVVGDKGVLRINLSQKEIKSEGTNEKGV